MNSFIYVSSDSKSKERNRMAYMGLLSAYIGLPAILRELHGRDFRLNRTIVAAI
jgi:hypothetical protein